MTKDALTKEAFTGLFPDLFQFTHYAINIAQQQIQSGNEDLNVTQMLKEIRKNPPEKTKVEQEEE